MAVKISQSDFEAICEEVLRNEFPNILEYSFGDMHLTIRYRSNSGRSMRGSGLKFSDDCQHCEISDTYGSGEPLHVARSIRRRVNELYGEL